MNTQHPIIINFQVKYSELKIILEWVTIQDTWCYNRKEIMLLKCDKIECEIFLLNVTWPNESTIVF
jgi:hypothetical protein